MPVACKDINKDGYIDILTDYDTYYKNSSSGQFTSGTLPSVNFLEFIRAYEDIDNDGFLDFVTTEGLTFENDKLYIYYGKAGNGFDKVLVENKDNYGQVKIIDFNNDGKKDITIVSNYSNPQNILILKNNGNRTFAPEKYLINTALNINNRCHELADFDNDGDKDLVLADESTNDVLYLFENKGSGFSSYKSIMSGIADDILYFRSVDIDYDGDSDLISISNRMSTGLMSIYYHINTGQLKFLNPVKIGEVKGFTGFGWQNDNFFDNWFSVMDVDNDNVSDIVLNAAADKAIVWFENKIPTQGATFIVVQPTSKTACEGKTATFSVTATGKNLTYQWQKNGIDINGATLKDYTIAAATVSDAGDYTCIVKGDNGSITTNIAKFTLNTFVNITSQPVSVTLKAGEKAEFKVEATGSINSYQWFKDGQYLEDNADISGATQNQLTISNVKASDKGMYYCKILGKCNTVYSDTVQLDITSKVIDLDTAGITISPNPASDHIQISSDKYQVSMVELYNVQGQIVVQQVSDINTIDISMLRTGLYIIKIYSGQGVAVGKVVVE